MAVYNLKNYTDKDGLGFPLNFRRGNPNPLDNSAVWSTYADALNYAKTDATAYVGQIITVVNYTDAVMDDETVVTPAQATVDVYKIELDSQGIGTLVKVSDEEASTAISALEAQFSTLSGTVDTISSDLDAVESDVSTAKNDIAKAKEDIAGHTESISTLSDDVDALEDTVGGLETTVASHTTALNQYDVEKANYATKTEVATAKSEAIADAKTETEKQITAVVSQYLTGEGAADTIDTLQEIVDWLNTEGSGADKIVADVKAIQDDYLKSTDKTELNKSISDLATFVGELPEDATSTTVVAYITEVVNALKISDYAKAEDLTTLASRVTTVEGKVKTLEETTLPGIDTRLNGIDTAISTLNNTTIPNALADKVDKQSSEYNGSQVPHRLLTPEEAEKLSKLVLNADGSVTTGQQVAAGDVVGLADWLQTNGATYIKNLSESNLTDALVSKISGAVREVKLGDKQVTITDGLLAIPAATADTLGLVQLGAEFKTAADGKLEVNALNVNKLVQTAGEYLELNGGSATGFDE